MLSGPAGKVQAADMVGDDDEMFGVGNSIVLNGEHEARSRSEFGVIGKIEVESLTNRLVFAGARAIFDMTGDIARADRLVVGERSVKEL